MTRLAAGLVIDLAEAFREEIAPYLSSLMPQILEILRSDDRKQDTKLQAFNSLSSVACYASESFCNNFLTDSLTLMQQAAALSVRVQDYQDDPDTLDYLGKLRGTLLEAYSQITLGVSDSNTHAAFLPFVPSLFQFLNDCCTTDRS